MWLTPTTGPRSQGKAYLTAYGADMTMRESPVGAELRDMGLPLPPATAFRVNAMGIRLGTLAHAQHTAALGGQYSPWPLPVVRSAAGQRP